MTGGVFVTKASISGGSLCNGQQHVTPGTGRGLANIGGLDFVYYVIDSQHVEFMGIDQDAAAPGTILGEASAQLPGTTHRCQLLSITAASFSSWEVPERLDCHSRARDGSLRPAQTLSAVTLDNNNAGQRDYGTYQRRAQQRNSDS